MKIYSIEYGMSNLHIWSKGKPCPLVRPILRMDRSFSVEGEEYYTLGRITIPDRIDMVLFCVKVYDEN